MHVYKGFFPKLYGILIGAKSYSNATGFMAVDCLEFHRSKHNNETLWEMSEILILYFSI